MAAARQRELEAKFEISPDLLPALQSNSTTLNGYTRKQVGTQSQIDSYLDTPAYDLLRHGLSLRVRQNGDKHEVGIKSLQATHKGSIADRLDVAIPLPAHATPLDVSTWPKAVDEQLEELPIALEELRPVVVVHQQRQKSHVLSGDEPQPLAEWSLDDVWIGTEDEADDSHAVHFHELEIELLGQAADENVERASDFGNLVNHVQAQFELTPIHASKFVRGLESAIAQMHNGDGIFTPEMDLAAACRLFLHQQLLQILLNEHGVRMSKKPKYVHEMRVAIRRARAVILLFGHAFQHGALNPTEKGLKRLGSALGAVRDLDVALENLSAFHQDQPASQQAVIEPLRKEVKKRRRRAHTKLVALLDGKKYRKFIVVFEAFCGSDRADATKPQPDEAEIHPSQLRHTAPSIILRTFEGIRAYEVAFANNQRPTLATFHALRIQAKNQRYLLEFSQNLLGASGESVLLQLKELQEHLGQLNDARVEQERLKQWAEQMKEDKDLRSAIDARLEQIAATIEQLATDFPARFAEFINLSNRNRLGAALAEL